MNLFLLAYVSIGVSFMVTITVATLKGTKPNLWVIISSIVVWSLAGLTWPIWAFVTMLYTVSNHR